MLYLVGVGTAGLLETKKADQVCVAASLSHWFGVGSCVSAFLRNAAVYLPDPSRLDVHESTLLVTEKQHLDAFRGVLKSGTSKLRGGLVKVGSGNLVLNEKEDLANVPLFTLGTGEDSMRSLFNASVDTYYSYK
jgi:hypothetical protein